MPRMASIPFRRRLPFIACAVLACVLAAWLVLVLLGRPSNDRDWAPDQARLPIARIDGDSVTISNLRNTHYRSTTDFDVRWETRTYDLRTLDSLWFMVEPFAAWRGPAHTLLSFGFSDGHYVAVSVEIRKEAGESFSPLLGLLRQYELTYVVGDERDLIGLRANHRRDDVHLYRLRATPAQARALFLGMLDRANALAAQPEFYNTLTNTCTTNIVDHIEQLAPGTVPLSYKTVLPAYSDDLAYDLGLIDTALPRDSYRSAHRINEAAARFADSPAFSRGIRMGVGE